MIRFSDVGCFIKKSWVGYPAIESGFPSKESDEIPLFIL